MTGLPEGFDQYLATRDRERQEQVATMNGWLTPREQRLVREAAVMGFVQGKMWGEMPSSRTEPHPKDSDVLARVLLGCDSFPDLYPTITKPPVRKRWYTRARRTRDT